MSIDAMVDPEQRFDGLWRDHAQAVLRYARRRVPPGDVDDVVAETFVVAWRRLADVPEQPLPWLLGVARRVAANSVRSAHRRSALAGRVAVEEHAGASGPWDPFGPGDATLAALDRLPEADRELLTLLAWDGLSQEEAADALGCTRGAVKVRLHRARKRFAAALSRSATTTRSPAQPVTPPTQPPGPALSLVSDVPARHLGGAL